jgi:hypothetical protein
METCADEGSEEGQIPEEEANQILGLSESNWQWINKCAIKTDVALDMCGFKP